MNPAKKTLAFVLSALMVLTMLPQAASTAEQHSVCTPEELADALLCEETTNNELSEDTDYDFGDDSYNKEDGGSVTEPFKDDLFYIDESNSVYVKKEAGTETGAVCKIGETEYDTLDEALATVDENETEYIDLLCDIDYEKGLVINGGRSITFMLNDYTLNIINDAGTALEVGGYARVAFDWGPREEGELNVFSAAGGNGVSVYDGGIAFVTNATAANSGGEGGVAAAAIGPGSRVTLYGDANCTNPYAMFPGSVLAVFGASIVVRGDVNCTGNLAGIEGLVGVFAAGGGSVEAEGSVSVSYVNDTGGHSGTLWGASVAEGSTIIIDGDVTVNGEEMPDENGEIAGASAMGGTLIVDGDITVDGKGEVIGAISAYGGTAVLNGAVTVPESAAEIALGNDQVTDIEGVPGELPDDLLNLLEDFGRQDLAAEAYLVYSCIDEAEDGGEIVSLVYMETSAGPVCTIGDRNYTALEEALGDADEGAETTIKLLRDIDYKNNSGIEVVGKTVVFDLNGYVLKVTNESDEFGNGLTVGTGGVVDIMDTSVEQDGEFWAGGGGYGVYAHDGGQATVSIAMGMQAGAYAADLASVIRVKGMVAGMAACVRATGGGSVIVDGKIQDLGGQYIVLEDVALTPADGMPGTGADEGYIIYSDENGNVVRVKSKAVCRIDTILYDTLYDALLAVESMEEGLEATITLLQDIENNTGIEVEGRTITFDLNGHTLKVTNQDDEDGNGLTVGAGGVVEITDTSLAGDGEFNVASSAESGYGIYVHHGGQATVTSAEATGMNSAAACAEDASSSIRVTGDVSSSKYYVLWADNGAAITVGGDAEGAGGPAAFGSGSSIKIAGDVTSSAEGAMATGGGTVEIDGNVSVSGDYCYGAATVGAGSRVSVGGEVTVSGAGAVGVFSVDGGSATISREVMVSGTGAMGVFSADGGLAVIDGVLTAPEATYIVLEISPADPGEEAVRINKTPADCVAATAPYENYLLYSDGVNSVYLKIPTTSATISPATATFDKNPAEQRDITVNITWNSAVSVKDVKAGATSVGEDNYSVDDDTDTLTIKKDYLLSQPIGYLVLNIEFDQGISAILTIAVVDTTPPVISPASVNYDLNEPAGIIINITWNSAESVTGVTHGSYQLLPGTDYIVSYNTLTINDRFISALGLSAGDKLTFVITFNTDVNVDLTVDVRKSHTSSGGGSSGQSSSQTRYWAAISGDGSGQLPVTVDMGAGSVSLDLATLEGSLSSGQSTIVTVPVIPGVNSCTARLLAASLSGSGAGSFTLNTAAGSVTVPGNMIAGTNLTGKVGLAIGKGDTSGLPNNLKAAIGDRPVIRLTLTINGMPTEWNNPDAPVTVSIPYTPTAAELNNPEGIVICYIDGSGNAVSVPNGRYDPATGTVTFSITHFSDFAVVYCQVTFGDVAEGAWYYKAVSFIAAREITRGTGGGNFSPDAKLTRGQFLVMLMRAYDIAPDSNPAGNFSDAGSTYYTGYLAAARRLGISEGVGNNMYAPEKEITRQEMFTLLYNALKIMGKLPQGDPGKTASQFSDAEQVEFWAQDAIDYLVRAGVISGSNRRLTPIVVTSRAEMAQLLYSLLYK